MTRKRETDVFYGSGNVFADIGFENPKEELAIADAIIDSDHNIDIQPVDGGWLVTTTGGSLKIKDLGDGRAEVGDWVCDGTNDYAAISLYKAAIKFIDGYNLHPVISVDVSDGRLIDFYARMGWEATHLICIRTKDKDFWESRNNNG